MFEAGWQRNFSQHLRAMEICLGLAWFGQGSLAAWSDLLQPKYSGASFPHSSTTQSSQSSTECLLPCDPLCSREHHAFTRTKLPPVVVHVPAAAGISIVCDHIVVLDHTYRVCPNLESPKYPMVPPYATSGNGVSKPSFQTPVCFLHTQIYAIEVELLAVTAIAGRHAQVAVV